MELNIKDKVALVIGGSKGIGKSVACAFVSEGCTVYIMSRDEKNLKDACDDIHKDTGVKPKYIIGDVADKNLCSEVIGTITNTEGRLDILVNNCAGPKMGGFLEHSNQDWDDAYFSNLYSIINYTTQTVPYMKKQGWGRILNITTVLAKEPSPNMVLSATMRAGVSAFSKSISQELAEFNITVNTICPSAVLTDRMVDLTRIAASREGISYDDVLDRAQKNIPAKRFSTPEEIADLALFLASEKAGYITGVSHMIDGGLTKSVF